MAKKPTAKPKAKRTPGPSGPVPTQPDAITIRGSAEWKQWLEAFVAKMRTKPTALIDFWLAKGAASEGFSRAPAADPVVSGEQSR